MKMKKEFFLLCIVVLFVIMSGCGTRKQMDLPGVSVIKKDAGMAISSMRRLSEADVKEVAEVIAANRAEENSSEDNPKEPGNTSNEGTGNKPDQETPGKKPDTPAGNWGDIGKDPEKLLSAMTLEEKVAQLFIVLPEALTGVSNVTTAGEKTRQAFQATPVGGLIYMGNNLKSREQVKEMLANVRQYSKERIGLPPFLCVDEEGGKVARIAGQSQFGVPNVGNMCDIGASGDVNAAYAAGETISGYLAELGFNVDFAPVADVWDNPANTVVKYRSFGTDPRLVSDMSTALLNGLRKNQILGAMKHFPGHGSTEADTHAGYAYTNKTMSELEACELIPFQAGIANDVEFIMVGHISLPNVTGDHTPASLSSAIITGILREKLQYQGLVITDALNMGAITQDYSSRDAAVMALKAGVDVLLMPKDFTAAYQGVLEAVRNGEISEARIDSSVRRILKVKVEKLR